MRLHLPKLLLTAVLAAFSPLAQAADSISISFGGTNMDNVTDSTSHLDGVTKDGWNIVAIQNTADKKVNNQNGIAAGTLVLENIFGQFSSSVDNTSTVTGAVQRDYIDINNQDHTSIYTVKVTHNYWLADVTYYMSGDASGTYAPMVINGQTYINGKDNILDADENPAWGTRGGVTEYNENNTITVTALASGSITAQNVYTSPTARATLAGMQIRDSEGGYRTTLNSGITAASDAIWMNRDTTVAYADIKAGEKYLGINADAAGSTLQLIGGETVNSLAVLSNTATIQSESAVTITELYTAAGAGVKLDTTASISAIRNHGSLAIGQTGVLKSDAAVVESILPTLTGTGRVEVSGNMYIKGNPTKDGSGNVQSPGIPAVISYGGTVVMDATSKLTIGSDASGQYTHKGWAVNMDNMGIEIKGGGIHFNGGASTLGTLIVKGDNTLHTHDARVKEEGLTIKDLQLEGDLEFTKQWKGTVTIESISKSTGCITNANGGTGNDSAYLIIGATDTSLVHLSGTLQNTGNLTLNGDIRISEDLSQFTTLTPGTPSGLSVNGTDGYQLANNTYLLVDNNNGSVTLTPQTATYKGSATTLTQDTTTGDVTFTAVSYADSIYQVNTQDATFGGSNASANTARATGFIVAENRTATIAGGTDNATAAELLVNATGKGNIKLTTDVTLSQGTTQTKGSFTVSGCKLTIGSGDTVDPPASIASFDAITWDDATIEFNNREDIFNNLTVTTKGASLELYDMGNANENKSLTFAETTTLNGNLNLTSTWNSQLNIEKLTGSGNIVINDTEIRIANGSYRDQLLSINISGADKYTGQIQIVQNYGNLSITVAENAGVNVALINVNLADERNEISAIKNVGIGNTITLSGVTGVFPEGYTIKNDVVLQNTEGENAKAALAITDGWWTETNEFQGSVSGQGNFLIDKGDSANVHLTFKFSGDVSAWTGQMEVIGGEHDVIYTDSNIAKDTAVVVNNRTILARKASQTTTNGRANVKFDYSRAATVNSNFANGAQGLYLTTANSNEVGTTFTGKSISLSGLTVEKGKAAFTGVENLTMAHINLAETAQLSVGAESTGTVAATNATLAAGAIINGNFDLSQAKNLTLDGLGTKTVTVTGVLVMDSATKLTLDTDTMAAITGLNAQERINLFTVGNFSAGTTAPTADSIAQTAQEYTMSTFFTGTWDENLLFGFNGTEVYVVNNAPIPEPATATLSLLALAALAARRRRH